MNGRFRVLAVVAVLAAATLVATPAAADPPQSGAPDATTCGISQLSYAKPIEGDRSPEGLNIVDTISDWGGFVPIIMLHGWTGSAIHDDSRSGAFSALINMYSIPGNEINLPRSLIGQLQGIPGAAVYTFDYHQDSGKWVTDKNIGPALGRAIDCLYRASGQKVILVGHSMGGLASRYALNETGPNGEVRADEVSTLITFGTPNTGSVVAAILGGAADVNVLDISPSVFTGIKFLLATCGALTTDSMNSGTPCDLLNKLGNLGSIQGEAGRALRSGSKELAALGLVPPGVKVIAYAGETTFKLPQVGVFGLLGQTIDAPVGDVIVTKDSALMGAEESDSTRCSYQLSAVQGALQVTGALIGQYPNSEVARSPLTALTGPCFHGALMQNVTLTNSALGAVDEEIAARAPQGSLAADSKYRQYSWNADGPLENPEFDRSAYFSSPSGNITCVMTPAPGDLAMGCYLATHEFPTDPRPDWCNENITWAPEYVFIYREGASSGACTGGALVPTRANPLPYGESINHAGYTCLSAENGVTCTSNTTGKGFKVNRSSLERIGGAPPWASTDAGTVPAPPPEATVGPDDAAIPGEETDRITFEHPTWGETTLVTSLSGSAGTGYITVFDSQGAPVWAFDTGGSPPWYAMSLNDPPTDASGNIYINWDPGRFNGVTALHPVPDGFEDYDTLMDTGDYNGRFYNAELEDVDGDGTLEVTQFTLDCNPSCANGNVSSETFWWTGSGFDTR